MNTNTEATAVATAPIKGTDIAVHTIKTATSAAHMFFTAIADIHMYAGAHIIKAIDKTQSIQDTVDYVEANTESKLVGLREKMSGYKKV